MHLDDTIAPTSEDLLTTIPTLPMNINNASSSISVPMEVEYTADSELADIEDQNKGYIEEETMIDSNEGIAFAPGNYCK